MMTDYPVRVRVGVLSMILFALLSSGLALRWTLERAASGSRRDEVGRYEARFQTLRSALPSTGVVGYLAEPKGSERPFDADYAKRFYLTQYALAPLIVVDSTEPALVIGNFRSAGAKRGGTNLGLILVGDFGDGVLLFRHQAK
jgi:hypothetical protein